MYMCPQMLECWVNSKCIYANHSLVGMMNIKNYTFGPLQATNERTFKDEYKAWEWYPHFWKYCKTACMKNQTGFISSSLHTYENIPEPWDKQGPLWEMESRLHWIHKEKTLCPTHKYFQTERERDRRERRERERRRQGNTQNDNVTQFREYENMTGIVNLWWREPDVMFTLDDDKMYA